MVTLDPTQIQDFFRIQTEIAAQIVLDDPPSDFLSIGAIAQTFLNDVVISSAIIVDSSMNVTDESIAITKTTVPYVAGFLFFREGPAAVAAFHKLHSRPDVVIIHGCGINHPRFAGFASHLGVVLGISTIGISNTTLCGEYHDPTEVGRSTPLKFNDRQLGFVLKTIGGAKPIFLSPGHRISQKRALLIVQRCVVNHRIPEPLRLAKFKARQTRFIVSRDKSANNNIEAQLPVNDTC